MSEDGLFNLFSIKVLKNLFLSHDLMQEYFYSKTRLASKYIYLENHLSH